MKLASATERRPILRVLALRPQFIMILATLLSTFAPSSSSRLLMLTQKKMTKGSSVLMLTKESQKRKIGQYTSLLSSFSSTSPVAFAHHESRPNIHLRQHMPRPFATALTTSTVGLPQSRSNLLSKAAFSSDSLESESSPVMDSESLDQFLQQATSIDDFFASSEQFPNFESLGIRSPILLKRITTLLQTTTSNQEGGDNPSSTPRPSAVQAASFLAMNNSGDDLTIGAETGSGKTLAYLLPLIDDILQRKQEMKDGRNNVGYDYARAVILVPNKELANQVVRMAMELCGGPKSVVWGNVPISSFASSMGEDEDDDETHTVRLGVMPGGLKKPEDFKPFREAINDPVNNPPLDIVITTPASLGPLALNPKNIDLFADIRTLVIDEADMLFDGGYLRPLENVLMGFRRSDRLDASLGVAKTQHVLVAATLPNMGLKSVDAYVQKKFPYATRVTMSGMHNARHYGLKDQNVWIQDSSNEELPKKKRMESLIEILKTDPTESDDNAVGLAGEKIMIFLNSVDDVDSANGALLKSGIDAVPFHAKISLEDRTINLNKFRKFVAHAENNDDEAVPILVCTDLAARGIDIPGVTSVVQLQFAGNVVTHLHRMGRCGRAGNRDGRGLIFYGDVENDLVDVVRQAELDQETMVLKGSDIEDTEGGESGGKVQNAFSRKRGFTKKRKKIARQSRGDY